MAAMTGGLAGWSDVTPVPQDDGPNPIVPIAYPARYVLLMDYMRAALHSGEISQRVLELTEEVVRINTAHYTAWHLRRRCLFELGSDLKAELDFMAEIAEDNVKNYQIWYHRRAIVERSRDASREAEFVNGVLAEDAKNYHAWAHRQWVLQAFGGWDGELEVVCALLEDDLRNNSAWHHRWFVVHRCGQPVNELTISREVSFALGYIKQAPNNESPWNYLRGYFVHSPGGLQPPGANYADFPEIKHICLQLKETEPGASCPHVYNLLSEIYEEEGGEDALLLAVDLLQHLANELDVTREKYWLRRVNRVTKRLYEVLDKEGEADAEVQMTD